jgi:hypothetical protein
VRHAPHKADMAQQAVSQYIIPVSLQGEKKKTENSDPTKKMSV